MRVYKRGPGWWADFAYTDAQGQEQRWRRSLKLPAATPKREVQARAEEIRKGLHALTTLQEHGVYLPLQEQHDAPCPFSGLAKLWLEHRSVYVGSSSRRSYGLVIKLYLYPTLEHTDAREITPLRVRDLQASLKQQGYSPATINQAVQVLRSILAKGVEGGWLPTNAADKIKPLGRGEDAWDWYTYQETSLFLKHARELYPQWHALMLVGFRTGLRPGELLALQWQDVDLHAQELLVRRTLAKTTEGVMVSNTTKGRRSRRVPLTSDALEVLLEQDRRGPYVFASERGQATRHHSGLAYAMERSAEAAGLRAIRAHDMRHSFAAQLVSAGESIKVVAEILGHRSVQTTELYAHLAPSSLKNALASIDPQHPKLKLVV